MVSPFKCSELGCSRSVRKIDGFCQEHWDKRHKCSCGSYKDEKYPTCARCGGFVCDCGKTKSPQYSVCYDCGRAKQPYRR